jgi:hypothetical protein
LKCNLPRYQERGGVKKYHKIIMSTHVWTNV